MKFGIIGTGWITETYIDGALDSGLWEFTAIFSRSLERGLEFGKKYGVTKVFTDIEEMAASADIDAVYVASPNSLHFTHCRALLKHGKHVICEKPLAAHLKEVLELYTLATENHVIFLEAIMFMHLPEKKLLEEAISKIGPISLATFDFSQRSSKYDRYLAGELPNIFNPKLETGALMDLGVYCLYPALVLFGPPESYTVDATLLGSGADGAGVITLRYSDKLVCLRYSKLGQAGANSDIQGDFGTVSIESISRLANINITYSDGTIEHICADEPKYKLMGYEAKDFHRYINEPEKTAEEYSRCCGESIFVTDYLEKFRSAAKIQFPSDQ
ncbi:MAG: Gfo/Idh/MocA family oxidoreductase [Oscillospiraceae bacterium]